MRVKQRLAINTVVMVASVVAVLVVLLAAARSVIRAAETSKVADAIITGAFERVTLRTDYLRTGSERAQVQVRAKHEEIGRLLKSAFEKFTAPEDKKTIDALLKGHESIGKNFMAIVKNRKSIGPHGRSEELSKEIEDRLLSQLNMRVYEAVLLGGKLQRSGEEAFMSAIKLAGGSIAFVLLLAGAVSLINSRIMSREITDRIQRLRDGAAVIGGGDLNHRIDLAGDDEFADLSAAFNAMTAKLYVSYENLEKKIEEHERAKDALRDSEERFRAVFEASSDCILVWDRQCNYLYANQAAIDHVGTTRDKVIGKNIRDGLGHVPDFMHLWMARVEQAFATGEPFRVEDAVSVGERLVYSESQISPIRDASGQVFAVSVVYRDVTERRQAETALRESEGRLKRSQEIAHLGSWELDLVKNHLLWTDEVYRIFGLQPQAFEATYDAFLESVHPDDRAAVDEAYSGSLREGRDTYEIEHRIVRKATGEVRVVHEKCEHFRDGTGKIVRSAGMVHDITERKKAEEDILKLSEDMVARNIELEFLNKELEAFIYSISHDLRAPVRSMANFAKFLAEDYANKLDGQGHDYLNRINRGAEKMTRLIEDLLRLSKVSRQEIIPAAIDLSKMASCISGSLREANPERNVSFSIQQGLTADADTRLMEIVLSNLFENAWKFTSKKERAHIDFGSFEREGKTVYYVKDDGAGFDQSHVEKIFWPFQRLHADTEFEGTGIGLSIVERIIHRHGGRIWAEAEVGKGATIYFTLT